MITDRGVGNGASLLIFLGIASRLPVMVKNTYDAVQMGQSPVWGVVALLAVFLGLVVLIVCLQQGVLRKIMVLGARRNLGRQVFAAPDDFLYLPVNPSGVMAIHLRQLATHVSEHGLCLSWPVRRPKQPDQAVWQLATSSSWTGWHSR